MTDSRETTVCGAEGVARTLRQSGSGHDDTSERTATEPYAKGATRVPSGTGESLRYMTEAQNPEKGFCASFLLP